MDRILGFILLVILIALLFSIVLGLCWYGVNIMEQHPIAGLFLTCLGIAIFPTLIIGGR
jgi:hypothetical protein